MVGLQYVNTAMSTLVNPEDPESESEGWMLEKTVKETFTDIMAKMKAMSKGGQVEEGEGDAVATVSWADPAHLELRPLPLSGGRMWDIYCLFDVSTHPLNTLNTLTRFKATH